MWVDQKRYKAMGAVLQRARERAGLTQQQLAKRLGKPQSFISNFERGQRRIDILELLKIAEALRADARKLVGAVERAVGPQRR